MNALQVWNNAAFDNGDIEEESALTRSSWCQPMLMKRSQTLLTSESTKENQTPIFFKSPAKSPIPITPLHPNGASAISVGKPLKLLFKQGLLPPSPNISKNGDKLSSDDKKIDTKIEAIEMEITRLSSMLEALRLEKAEKELQSVERSKRVVSVTTIVSAKTKMKRRGVSMGPCEIMGSDVRSSQQSMGKRENTPIQTFQKRRKSFFIKLPEIDEDKVTKRKGGRSLSLSPESCMPISKQRSLTVLASTKKPLKKEIGVMSSIQAKKLFAEGEKSVPSRKPVLKGRVIASRYNQIPSTMRSTDQRKRPLPEYEKEETKRFDKKRASSFGNSNGFGLTKSQVKRQWEIPEAMNRQNTLGDSPLLFIARISDVLPKIRTLRFTNESPRDSGPAKKVVELVGRKSYFGEEAREVGSSVCQALSFEEEEKDSE